MPGNEVGDRVHNFFDQGSLSQDQRHTQLAAANWPAFNNNIWSANERQTGGPVNSSSENYSAQQSDIERGQGNQILLGPQGLNFARSSFRPEFVKSPQQLQQLNLNGFMHASQAVQSRQNEANFLGVDTESDRHNMTSRGMSVIESQQRSGPQQMNSARFGGSDSPMNFSFLGGQQQMNGQQPGMMQSLSRQQPANNDAQLQQQMILKQMQELQRQQQFQQLEAMQRSAVSHNSSFPNQSAGQHLPMINGSPMHDTSNYPWSPQVMAGNTNWQQRGVSPVQGYSNGYMISPEQGQAMHFMGMIPQQSSQSLYGVPVPGSRNANAFSHSNIDKPGMFQGPSPNSSFSGNQYGPVAEQMSVKDGTIGSRIESEENRSFRMGSSQRLGNMVNLGGFTSVQQRNVAMPEGGGQGFAGGSDFVTEKPVTQSSSQGASAQSAVALDPTEEKILFGSDDNIWEAFGGSSLAGSGDATDLLNGFPSMQSGTWSALMQSAVAESTSTDVAMQEEWSGVGSQNSQSQSGNQHPSAFPGTEKSQLNFVENTGRASLAPRLSSNDASTHSANTNTTYVNSSGRQPPLSNQRRESLQTESEIAQEGRRWLDSNQQKPHVEEKRMVENSNSSISRTDTAFWSHQQNAFSQNNNAQQSNRPSPSNFIGYVPANGGLASTIQDNLLDKDHNMQMSTETGRGGGMRLEPVPNATSSLVSSKDDAVPPGSSNIKINYESSQKQPNNHHLDLWKSVNSSGKSGFEGSDRDMPKLNRGAPTLESSGNSPDGGAAETHETENGDRRESSSDSHRSNYPPNVSVGLRENMWSDTADRPGLPGAKDNSSGQTGKRGPVSRKFQYHPMGDLDMDSNSSYSAKQVLHSQPMSQHLLSGIRSQEANPRFLGQLSTNITDMEKGRASNVRGAVNVSSGGAHPGYLPSTSAPFVRSGELSSPNQHMSPSQNMLELLHKVDQSKEQTAASHLNSSDYNRASDIPAVGHAAPNQSHFSTSHGFSLQLAPPSQGVSNHNEAAQSSSKTVDSPNIGYIASEKGDKTHAWLPPVSSSQSLPPSCQPVQMESGNEPDSVGITNADVSVPRNLSAPLSSSYLRNTLQSQHFTAPGGKSASDQSATMSLNRHAYDDQQLSNSQPQATTSHPVNNIHDSLGSGRDMNQSGMRALVHQMPASLRAVMSGMSRKDNLSPLGSNIWASQQQLLGAQAGTALEVMKSQFQSPDAPDTSFTQQKKDEQDSAKSVDALSSHGMVGVESQAADGRSTMKAAGAVQEEDPSARQLSSASPSNSAVSQKDIESFNYSVKSNNNFNSYSLLHQMQAMKSMGTDPSHRESKRLKGQDNGLDPQHIAGQATEPATGSMDGMTRDPSMSQTSVSAGDAKVLSFSPHLGNRNPSFQLPHGTVVSQDMLSFGRIDPRKFTAGNPTGRNEHTGISAQMAPSWFEQYGTLKNGQLLPVHNAPRIPMVKTAEQQFNSGKSPSNLVVNNSVQFSTAVTESGQVANTCQTANAYTPTEHVSSLQALVPHVPAPSSASMRPKKRKTSTSDLLPWNKEIGQSLKRLQNMSLAEVDWAQSSNRLIEKVEDEVDNSEDLLPVIRPKRRLLLTTQLMQQVFQPPSAAVLLLDASSNYEVIVYSLARSVLGDACSLVSGVESNSPVESENALSVKVKTSERIRDQYFSKVVEDFATRSKELEEDLLRLDKRASILDFRLDCQDLERFSVINRFARFHGRGQVDGAETSSSSDTTAVAQKPCPQRYVSAHPMPRNVPERVQCLSL